MAFHPSLQAPFSPPPEVLRLSFIPFKRRECLEFLLIWIHNQSVALCLKDIRNTGHPITLALWAYLYSLSTFSFLRSWNLTLELMFQGPHERRGMQRKKEKKEPTPVFWWLDPIRASPMREPARVHRHLYTLRVLPQHYSFALKNCRSPARHQGLQWSRPRGRYLSHMYWKMHETYTEKLLAGSFLPNALFHVASDLHSLAAILQTKCSRAILKHNTGCASFPTPTQGKIIVDVTLIAAHSFISSADSNHLPRHHTEAQPTCLHRRSQGSQRLAAVHAALDVSRTLWSSCRLLHRKEN